MISLFTEIIKAVVVFLGHYYSPDEIRLRRSIKKDADSKEAREKLNHAIHDQALNDMAVIISKRLAGRMRDKNADPSRWREGFSSIGLRLPTSEIDGGRGERKE